MSDIDNMERRSDQNAMLILIQTLQRDIQNLHNSIEKFSSASHKLAENVAVLNNRVLCLESKERPCQWFNDHMKDHQRRSDRGWALYLRVVGSVLGWLLTGVLGATIALWWKQQ